MGKIMQRAMAERGQSVWLAAMPSLFVVLWSTGFVGAKLGLPYAPPLTFLLLRFVIVAVLLVGLALVSGAPWPKSWTAVGHLAIAGGLLHGVYLGGVFASISLGVPAGVSALIVGIQPLLTAAAAGPLLGERVSTQQWTGLLLGLIGVALVVWEKLGQHLGTPFGMALSGVALLGITAGTLYQKRFCGGMDLRTGNVVQFVAAAALMAVSASLFETMQVHWTGEFVFALGWLCLVLSIGAISLLYLLIRRGAASKVASLFYMVPPVTALMAYPLFGETLNAAALAGMVLVVIGVALVNVGR